MEGYYLNKKYARRQWIIMSKLNTTEITFCKVAKVSHLQELGWLLLKISYTF